VDVADEREILFVAVDEAEVQVWSGDSHSVERDERSAEGHRCLCDSLVDNPYGLCYAAAGGRHHKDDDDESPRGARSEQT
jgi:hypothetical protein